LSTITSVADGDVLSSSSGNWVNSYVGTTTRADDDGTVALVTGDKDTVVTAAHATANAVSIARAGTAGFPLKWTVNFCTYGAGLSTITPDTSTIWDGATDAATLTLATGDCATIFVSSVTGNGKYFSVIKRVGATFGFILGAENGSAIVAGDDQPTIFVNRTGRTLTLSEVWIECDATEAGTTLNLQRDDGSPADILTSNVGCNTTGQTGTLSATEKLIANGDRIDLVVVAAGGTAKRATLWVTYR